MLTTRSTNAPTNNCLESSGKTRVLSVSPDEVVLLDCHCVDPVRGRAEHIHICATDEALSQAEHSAPDGAAANPHERHLTPWLIGGLALMGLIVVALGMFAAGGFRAMAVGLAWLIAGYSVAWIVVWAASIARARDEAEIEEAIVIRNIADIRPQDSINVR